ncbi:MAG TPA: glycosyltransferase family 4 protein [Hyphomonadaceae bacterium]|jgi:glycosyltransferase involved in cell wall biosynthesis|nr:glycosyltransferase family 4 protein [Hyphomonadaceae bacterium]
MVERVIFPFRGAELGGSHIAAFTLAHGLQRTFGTDCLVLAPEGTLILKEAARLGLRTLASGEQPTGKNSFVGDLARMNQRRAVLAPEITATSSIVHTSDINSLRAWGPAAKALGAGVVYHHHALNKMWWPPHLRGLAFADEVIAVSEATLEAIKPLCRDAVKELNPFDIDMSIDRAAAHEALRAENGWRDDALIVGFVGNLWSRKRPVFFLETAWEMFNRNSRCRFVMFGRDGDHDVAEIREHAMRLGVGAITAFPGFRQPVEANIACLDLLMCPAPREPFGRTLVEAIILGTPVAATEGAGHSEIIRTWGGGELVAEEATPAEMAAACVDVMAKAGDYILPEARRREIAAELSSDAHAERVMQIYERAVGRKRNVADRERVSGEHRHAA